MHPVAGDHTLLFHHSLIHPVSGAEPGPGLVMSRAGSPPAWSPLSPPDSLAARSVTHLWLGWSAATHLLSLLYLNIKGLCAPLNTVTQLNF